MTWPLPLLVWEQIDCIKVLPVAVLFVGGPLYGSPLICILFPHTNHPHVLLIFTHEPSLWSRSSLDLQPQLPFTNIIAVLPLNVSKHLHLLSLYPVKHCSECGTFNAMMRYKNQQI